MSGASDSLCECAPCVSLRVELTRIFGVPTTRSGENWNESMLRQIGDLMGSNLDQAKYVSGLLKQTEGALDNLTGRLS